jgi:ribosome biogenesis GTPase
MRELQLWDEETDLDHTFADIMILAEGCRYANCSHQHEPGCAVQQAVADGTLPGQRLENYFKLQREVAYQERRNDPLAERELKEQWKKIHRMHNKQSRRRDRR